MHKSKEGTGRVVMWRLGIRNSYTMESTFGGSSLGRTDVLDSEELDHKYKLFVCLSAFVHCVHFQGTGKAHTSAHGTSSQWATASVTLY